MFLGVTIDRSLSLNLHVDAVTKKANNTVSFLQRNQYVCPKGVKVTCYKTMMQADPSFVILLPSPTSTSWNLSNFAQQNSVTSSVTSMVEDLGWAQLEAHRQQAKAIMLYRIVNQLLIYR